MGTFSQPCSALWHPSPSPRLCRPVAGILCARCIPGSISILLLSTSILVHILRILHIPLSSTIHHRNSHHGQHIHHHIHHLNMTAVSLSLSLPCYFDFI